MSRLERIPRTILAAVIMATWTVGCVEPKQPTHSSTKPADATPEDAADKHPAKSNQVKIPMH